MAAQRRRRIENAPFAHLALDTFYARRYVLPRSASRAVLALLGVSSLTWGRSARSGLFSFRHANPRAHAFPMTQSPGCAQALQTNIDFKTSIARISACGMMPLRFKISGRFGALFFMQLERLTAITRVRPRDLKRQRTHPAAFLALPIRQTKKNPQHELRVSLQNSEEIYFCLRQAWRRPTLPGLET